MKKKIENKFILGIKKIPYNAVMRIKRLKKGITQKMMGKLIGLAGNSIGEIERIRKWPTEEQAYQIADILDVDVNILFPKWMADKILPKYGELNYFIPLERKSLSDIENQRLLSYEDEHEELYREEMKENLSKVLSKLSDRERKVLELRYGIADGVSRTLEETADEFRVTRERIRQIEEKAIDNLKEKIKNDKNNDENFMLSKRRHRKLTAFQKGNLLHH